MIRWVCSGRFMMPDKRCLNRLMMALRDPASMVRHVIPLNVSLILDMTDGSNELNDIVQAWWHYNNQTHLMTQVFGR